MATSRPTEWREVALWLRSCVHGYLTGSRLLDYPDTPSHCLPDAPPLLREMRDATPRDLDSRIRGDRMTWPFLFRDDRSLMTTAG